MMAAATVASMPRMARSDTMYEGSYDDDEDDADMIAASESEAAREVPEVFEVPRRGRGRPRKSEGPAAKPRSGYYVLDPASREGGLRRYIYYGSAPPAPVTEESA